MKDTDAGAEGASVRGVKVRLVNDKEPQGAVAIGPKQGGTKWSVCGEFLGGAQQEHQAA